MPTEKTTKRARSTTTNTSGDTAYVLSAALPYIIKDGQVHVPLVTSRETGRWVISRGRREKGETLGQAAKREAWEEAGVKGEIIAKEGEGGAIDSYRSFKKLSDNETVPSKIHVFLFRVTSIEKNWPEKSVRKRRLVTLGGAIELMQGDDLEAGLVALLESLLKNPPAEFPQSPDRPKPRPPAARKPPKKAARLEIA